MNSSNSDDWQKIETDLKNGECDVLLISPERLANTSFLTSTLPIIANNGGIGLVVVDEAHCISDWGHDFRPDYRRIVNIVKGLPKNVPLIATTAIANDRVVADVQAQLGTEVKVLRGPLTRASLRIQTINLRDQADRLAWLAENLPKLLGRSGPGLERLTPGSQNMPEQKF